MWSKTRWSICSYMESITFFLSESERNGVKMSVSIVKFLGIGWRVCIQGSSHHGLYPLLMHFVWLIHESNWITSSCPDMSRDFHNALFPLIHSLFSNISLFKTYTFLKFQTNYTSYLKLSSPYDPVQVWVLISESYRLNSQWYLPKHNQYRILEGNKMCVCVCVCVCVCGD